MVSLGFFSVLPPTEPCALRSNQPLKVSTRDFSWGKGGRCIWLMTFHPCSAKTSRKSGVLTYAEPLGPPRPVAGDLYCTFYFTDMSTDHSVSIIRAEQSKKRTVYQITLSRVPEDLNLSSVLCDLISSWMRQIMLGVVKTLEAAVQCKMCWN